MCACARAGFLWSTSYCSCDDDGAGNANYGMRPELEGCCSRHCQLKVIRGENGSILRAAPLEEGDSIDLDSGTGSFSDHVCFLSKDLFSQVI